LNLGPQLDKKEIAPKRSLTHGWIFSIMNHGMKFGPTYIITSLSNFLIVNNEKIENKVQIKELTNFA
jgi:hypothetical protein